MHIPNHVMRPLASVLSYLTVIKAVIITVASVAVWVFWTSFGHQLFIETLPDHDLRNIGFGTRLLGATLFLFTALVVAYGLLGLRQTFSEAAKGRCLSALSVNGFKRFAWVALALIPIEFVLRTLTILLLSLGDPLQDALVELSFGTEDLTDIFLALMLVVVAEIFAEGQRANDENATFY